MAVGYSTVQPRYDHRDPVLTGTIKLELMGAVTAATGSPHNALDARTITPTMLSGIPPAQPAEHPPAPVPPPSAPVEPAVMPVLLAAPPGQQPHAQHCHEQPEGTNERGTTLDEQLQCSSNCRCYCVSGMQRPLLVCSDNHIMLTKHTKGPCAYHGPYLHVASHLALSMLAPTSPTCASACPIMPAFYYLALAHAASNQTSKLSVLAAHPPLLPVPLPAPVCVPHPPRPPVAPAAAWLTQPGHEPDTAQHGTT